MCGIGGLFSLVHQVDDLLPIARAMGERIAHRGPDSEGQWRCQDLPLVLMHRRLAIIDLSIDGHQPMLSHSGRYIISFNGEIYNFATIRADLIKRGYQFKGGSDTEVMVSAFEEYGIEQAVTRFNGMFAFGVYDHKERILTLVRDRLGVKPLYYAVQPWGVAFSSEIKPFLSIPKVRWSINQQAVALMIRFGYVPSPYSIFSEIRKLPPGSLIQIALDRYDSAVVGDPHTYWHLPTVVQEARKNPWMGSYAEAQDRLLGLLEDAVSLRMVADVPLGAFLSGGIDSSLVVGLMTRVSTAKVKTFTIRFAEETYNEADFARKVAEHLGTDHHEEILTAQDALNLVPNLPLMFDEPFADPSQLPTFLVSQIARKKVTVALSGDGGDELFGGYTRVVSAERIWNILKILTPAVCQPLGGVTRWLGDRLGISDKLYRLLTLFMSPDKQSLYYDIMSFDERFVRLLKSGDLRSAPLNMLPDMGLNIAEFMMLADTGFYLPDDILPKVDRASMAVSLEAREPLLDYRLVEFVWQLPTAYRYQDRRGKIILRDILKRFVPVELFERPKMGFSVPIDNWLRGNLREWSNDLLSESVLQKSDIINYYEARRLLDEHQSGKADHSGVLWNLLMFQAWYQNYADQIV
jgi:asparagine synthase (glutamine-hydrolysing)